MTARAAIALAVLAAALTAPAAAHADDRRKAAEHFALGEAAEKRQDWRAAIASYEQAYAAAPHPAVLYNIGANYERLRAHRQAADYFRRYLDESPEAADRAEVEARIERLRAQPARVEIAVSPAGALVFVDGTSRGPAPLQLELPAGRHEIYAAEGGRTSEVREVILEFGEPVTVSIDLDAAPGILVVTADVAGAEVLVDGKRVGTTPYSGYVPSGPHRVVVSKPGHQSAERAIDLPPRGSEQVRVTLPRLAGPGVEAPAPELGNAVVFDMSYGFDSAASGIRYTLGLHWRPGRWQAGVVLGKLHDRSGTAFGIDGRVFLGRRALRPYGRFGAIAFRPASGDSASSRLELGAGVAYRSLTVPQRAMALEYVLELAGHVRTGRSIATDMDDPRLGAAFIFGIALRFGG